MRFREWWALRPWAKGAGFSAPHWARTDDDPRATAWLLGVIVERLAPGGVGIGVRDQTTGEVHALHQVAVQTNGRHPADLPHGTPVAFTVLPGNLHEHRDGIWMRTEAR